MMHTIYHFTQLLTQVGLRERESLVYMTYLIMGPNAITNIARKLHLPRSTTYNLTTDLVERGILKQIQKEKYGIYQAVNPHALMEQLQRRRAKINLQIQKMSALLQQLNEKGAGLSAGPLSIINNTSLVTTEQRDHHQGQDRPQGSSHPSLLQTY